MALPPYVIEMLERLKKRRTAKGEPEPTAVADEVPPGWVRLTREMLFAGRGVPSGPGKTWNAKQLAAIGISWADARIKGWIERNTGRLVRDEEYRLFLSLRRS